MIQKATYSIKNIFIGLTLLVSIFYGCSNKNSKKPDSKPEYKIKKEYKRGPVILTLLVQEKEITIAEHIKFTIEVRLKEEYDVLLPEFGEKLEQFGIVNYNSFFPQLIKDNITLHKKSYELEPFLSGEYKIPPMIITFWKKGEENKKKHELESEEILINVKSLSPEKLSNMTIFEISPPVELSKKGIKKIHIILAVFLISLLVVVFFIRDRKKKKTVTSKRPPHEIAFDMLEKLLLEDLIEKGQLKVFYLKLSAILRDYIENKLALKAPERTTEEFLYNLKDSNKLNKDHKELLKNFLEHCDIVKFAEHLPQNDEIQSSFDACKRFISETEEKKNAV